METTVKDGVFIHISRGVEDPHPVLMALTLAEKMSEDIAFTDLVRYRLKSICFYF